MAIVSSSYVAEAHTQADGRRYVRETHTDSAGEVHVVEYLAPAAWGDAEYAATMNARAAAMAGALAEAEFERILAKD